MDKIQKYRQYIKESLDPWKLKQSIKSFNRLSEDIITIPGDLKELSKELTKEFDNIKLPYEKLVNFGGIEVDIRVKKTSRYYSYVDWVKFLNGDYEIVIEVENEFDVNYLVSTIIHEIRHMIDFTDENINSGFSSFDVDRNLRKYNIGAFSEFFMLVYMSLEHELVARNSQIYPYIKFKNITKEESLKILKNSFIWKSLTMLKEFNCNKFINKFDYNVIVGITNNFIKECLYDNTTTIEDKDELLNFYKIWGEYFNDISDKWEEILLREVDIVYERKININQSFIRFEDVMGVIWRGVKNGNYQS